MQPGITPPYITGLKELFAAGLHCEWFYISNNNQ